ncbi:MAG: RDD family protein [Planctomycetes bacterium]|nr:RDD family protein [Planctomycetota bacterium]
MHEGWFYVDNHKQQGPTSLAELQYLFKSHKLSIATLVWHKSMTEWTAAESLKLFKAQPRVVEVEPEVIDSHSPPPPPPRSRNVSSNPSSSHPWRRFFARAIDTALLAPAFTIATNIRPTDWGDIKFSFSSIVFAMFVHAALQSSWGSTPGKEILGYKVRTQAGEKLTFEQALRREAKIAWHGLGFGIPFYSLYTQIKAYSNLEKTGITSWDKDDDLVVTHR